MSASPTSIRAIAELSEALKEKRAGVFIGSGISSASGLPSWSGLLSELIDELRGQPGVSPQLICDAEQLVADRNKWLILAQLLRNELGKSFTDYIERRFTDLTHKPNSIHDALIEIPWRAIVTTNYDRLIERSYARHFGADGDIPVFSYQNPAKIASNYRRGVNFVLKAHGDAREGPEFVVLTEADYRNLIHREIGYQTILQALFTTTSFLFIGCSLTDPDLRLLLQFIHSAFHGDTPTHYALVPENERCMAEDKIFYSEYRIHVIPIKPSDLSGSILSFLGDLKSSYAP
ncbi:MAG: SIR2 family protein [Verrucomicrobiota bacterium]